MASGPPLAPISPERLARIEARDPELETDLRNGLRFTHQLLAASRHDVYETAYTVLALIDELLESGAVDGPALAAQLVKVQQREIDRIDKHARVRLEHRIDKYKLASPDVPCEELIPICRGRCCSLHFPLSNQDLDERVVKWDYQMPYIIRQSPVDKYCVHSDRKTRGCTVYLNRPAVCRTYDCRNDKRIWLDYEKRIPAVHPDMTVAEMPVPDGTPPDKPWPFTVEDKPER